MFKLHDITIYIIIVKIDVARIITKFQIGDPFSTCKTRYTLDIAIFYVCSITHLHTCTKRKMTETLEKKVR